jgi:hypothetical protein
VSGCFKRNSGSCRKERREEKNHKSGQITGTSTRKVNEASAKYAGLLEWEWRGERTGSCECAVVVGLVSIGMREQIV